MLLSWLSRRLGNRQLHSHRPQRQRVRRLAVEHLESRQMLSTLPAGFQETTVTLGVNPTGFDFSPDGRMFIAEKHGLVSVFQPDGTRSPDPFFSVAVDEYRDRGLTAVLIDPNFDDNHFVYVYYTAAVPTRPNVADNGATNKLIRLTASASNPNVADPASQIVLLDGILSPTGIHQGGFLEFGTDGMLYVGVGDADSPTNSQDLSNLYGKVLRLDVHGSQSVIPPDNPFVGQIGKRPEIWAYGFRNPFSGTRQPASSQIYINDVGGATWEEINRLQKGGNYGWPLAEGTSTDPSFINPIYVYSHGGGGAAIVGGTFGTGTAFPATYTGQYF